jgi:hypothetical protein
MYDRSHERSRSRREIMERLLRCSTGLLWFRQHRPHKRQVILVHQHEDGISFLENSTAAWNKEGIIATQQHDEAVRGHTQFNDSDADKNQDRSDEKDIFKRHRLTAVVCL